MKKYFIILLTLILMGQIFALSEFDKHISNAKVYYDNGEFDKVINELTAALNIVKKNNQKGMIEAYKYLAFSYVAYDNTEKAKQYFIEILKIDSNFDLDRDITSPKILAVFDKAKIEFKKMAKGKKASSKKKKVEIQKQVVAKNKKKVAIKKEKKVKKSSKKNEVASIKQQKKKKYNFGGNDAFWTKAPLKKKKVNKTFKKMQFNATWRSAILPGWGQIYKKRHAKGYIFMATSVMLDALWVVSVSNVNRAADNYEKYKTVSSYYETKYWDSYEKSKTFYSFIVGMDIVFYLFNLADAAFFDWNKVDITMNFQKDSFQLVFTKRF